MRDGGCKTDGPWHTDTKPIKNRFNNARYCNRYCDMTEGFEGILMKIRPLLETGALSEGSVCL